MKAKVYMRVGRKPRGGKPSVQGNSKPSLIPLSDSFGPIPTVAFAIEVDIPDELFAQAQTVIAEIQVQREKATIAAKIDAV